jgi:hypothetical protein
VERTIPAPARWLILGTQQCPAVFSLLAIRCPQRHAIRLHNRQFGIFLADSVSHYVPRRNPTGTSLVKTSCSSLFSTVQELIPRNFKCLFHKPHIPIERVVPGRNSKAASSQPKFNPGNELRPGEKAFIPGNFKPCGMSGSSAVPLDRILNTGIFHDSRQSQSRHIQINTAVCFTSCKNWMPLAFPKSTASISCLAIAS